MGFSVVAGIILGRYVDKWVVGTETTTHWFTLLGLVVGSAAGFSFLIRTIKGLNKD